MTDNTPQNECGIVHCFYFLAIIILVPTGLIHGPDVLFYIGAGLFLLLFAVSIFPCVNATLALTFWGVVLSVENPFAGVPMAMVFVGFNIIMIATHHCSASFFFLLFGCGSAAIIPSWICSIWYLCRTSNQAMLTKELEDKRRETKSESIILFFLAGFFSVPGFVIPLKIWIANDNDNDRLDDVPFPLCTQIVWQTYVPYISLLLMVMLLVSYKLWNEYQKGEFEAVTVHPTSEQELTVVGPQKKKKDKYHHINDDATACTRELDYDDETVCTRELDNDGVTACTREPVGTGRNRAFLV